MITGDLKNQIDRLWDVFWSGGIANPLKVVDQITYLLFIKRLATLPATQGKKVTGLALICLWALLTVQAASV